jgi:hypothetical protein
VAAIPSVLFRVTVFNLVLCSTACVPLVQFTHSPRLAANVHRLKVGQSTQGEVLQYFGLPDIEAYSVLTKVNPRGPLAKFWGEHFKARRDWMESLPYSSIDQQHVTYLYVELEIRDSFELLYPDLYFSAIGSYRSSIRKNKLLIRFNRDTGVVQTISYGEQFR